jgi:Zn-dependent peptidase ImmA (M78 family)
VDYGYSNDDKEEREANEFARDVLIPSRYIKQFPFIAKSRALVKAFAKEIGIAPGIVVGRLQHDDFLYKSAFHDLKAPIEWA